jgi:prolyl oligopeptidase
MRSRLFIARHSNDGWRVDEVAGFDAMATLDIGPFDDLSCVGPIEGERPGDDYLVVSNDAVTPPTLWLLRAREAPQMLKQQPAGFDASGLTITQHEAISVDGVRIPYFQVARKDLPRDGSTPFLLTGYGGYQMCELPIYRISDGKLWLERGGAWVIANIRGGGEFGPAWHRAGQRAGKILTHDDFAAVANDLIARNVTRPARLACYGASNGGLLVGNMLTRYPELFGAIICDVPMIDMLRFTKLGMGHAWISEYGDPDKSEDRDYLRKMSPYHNVSPDKRYPPMFLMTSTRDDRVHPGHARKMAARLIEQGHTVYFDEAADGGHGTSVTTQQARKMALFYAFLRKTIAPELT